MATTSPAPRIVTLDIVRGVAVMGILAMNIIGFSLPQAAYMNPQVLGMDDPADFASWAFSFVFVDGKMRGLFSFLFGASMLLVIERATAKGESPAAIHYRRMVWLLVFGALHFYLIWWGDILFLYAAIGMIAFAFRNLGTRALVGWGIGLIVVQFVLFALLTAGAAALSQAAAQPGAGAEELRAWSDMQRGFAILPPAELARDLALYRGGYAGILEHRLAEQGVQPLVGVAMLGWETLGYFLLGMAALKSGFLTGGWGAAAYRRAALIGFAIGVTGYALLAWAVASSGFDVVTLIGAVMAAATLVRPAMIYAIAALIIVLARPGGALTGRIAAAGRAAFTNYLGTSIVMTSLFYGYGLGLYGRLDRTELWLVVIAAWALMLAWSKPWLERYRYGPFEWLWRSLSRGRAQAMRKRPAPAAAAAE